MSRNFFPLILLIIGPILWAQTSKDQLVGRVVEVDNTKTRGIPGVKVQLGTTSEIVTTDAYGKFKFNNPNGFVVGEPYYSFVLEKEGYSTVGSTKGMVVYGSGAINNLIMKKDNEKFLWITISDGKTGDFLENAAVSIDRRTEQTDAMGKVSFDLTEYDTGQLKASISRECYKDKIIEVPRKGRIEIELVPTCPDSGMGSNALDLNNALRIMENAFNLRDGSVQGQTTAIQLLVENGFDYKNTNFDGVSLSGALLPKIDFSSATFQVSDLSNLILDGGQLNEANLNFADFANASFKHISARETLFQFTQGQDVNFESADLYRSSFFLSSLPRANFRNADLTGVCLAFCDLTGADFTGADLTDTIFYGSVLDHAIFTGATVKNTDVAGAVADHLVLEEQQIDGLSRDEPVRGGSEIKIWGDSRSSKDWSSGYPDFNSNYTKIFKAPIKISTGLKMRTEGVYPIGAFYKGTRDIRSYHWFDAEFWEHGNRSYRIEKNLNALADFLYETIAVQRPIEGR